MSVIWYPSFYPLQCTNAQAVLTIQAPKQLLQEHTKIKELKIILSAQHTQNEIVENSNSSISSASRDPPVRSKLQITTRMVTYILNSWKHTHSNMKQTTRHSFCLNQDTSTKSNEYQDRKRRGERSTTGRNTMLCSYLNVSWCIFKIPSYVMLLLLFISVLCSTMNIHMV